MTFTPLMGMSEVVNRFYLEDNSSRAAVRMTVFDAPHFSEEQRQTILLSYAEHERDARSHGKPRLGSGAVFPIAEEEIVCKAFAIPEHWRQIAALDFGWHHPTAAIRVAHDAYSDIVYPKLGGLEWG